MKRGSVVITVGRGDFSRKPRPSLVVQAEAFNALHPVITVCPITTHLSNNWFYRVPIARMDSNGLLADSEVEIDLVQAIRRERIHEHIGDVSNDVMTNVDQALRRWLDL